MSAKKIGRILCTIIITFLIFFTLFQGNVFINKSFASEKQTDDIVQNSLLITVKEQAKMIELEQLIHNLYKDRIISIEKIEEANLLKVTLTDSLSSRELLYDLNHSYKNFIQDVGYERKIGVINNNQIKELQSNSILHSIPPSTGTLSKSSMLQSERNKFHSFQWDINAVTNNGESYNLQKGNHNIKVAIIDSGIDFNHPDLKGNIISSGKSFVPGINDTQDYLGHGTMVAGTIAANGNLMGIGPELGIVPYKVFQDEKAESSWIIQAIIQAAKDGMDVINLSLSAYLSKTSKEDKVLIRAYQNALRYAKHKGSVVVASAGNDALDLKNPKEIAEKRGYPEDYQLHFPGGSNEVITVSSTSKENTLASYSNYGGITFAAPGGDYGPFFNELKEYDITSWILVTYPTNLPPTPLSTNLGLPRGYELEVGSSLAAPKVSALAALLIAEYEEKYQKSPSPSLIENLLKKGAIDRGVNGFDKEFGDGEINAVNALNNVK
ncbi:hypothetical protein BACCIP111899_04027 [Bacillus rhizoplanae]|uniref:Peptidase S8/S53 domain-containing protein n=1 Tax=Bacillus rhizoplanae TaxID=2880966 RepID=A0ABM8YG61_9BACI|nr:S8 family serine peptidase [Bacillus rhizoplanae]CAG9614794.1 hypothetical protein BACCIP111899_04027 [Bacillus rhizoplanae]